MRSDGLRALELERASLRVRLVGLALGTTLLALAPPGDRAAAAATLVAYGIAALVLRAAAGRVDGALLRLLGATTDLAFAGAVAILVPTSLGGWGLLVFAVTASALRYRAIGTAAVSGVAIGSYVLVVAAPGDPMPHELWPVQLLLACGAVAMELADARRRDARERDSLRRDALGLRELARAPDEPTLLERLLEHAVGTFGATGAVVLVSGDAPTLRRGSPGTVGRTVSVLLAEDPRTELHAYFTETARDDRSAAALHDLASAARPILGALRERSRQATSLAILGRVHASLRSITDARTSDAIHERLASLTDLGPEGDAVATDGRALAHDIGAALAARSDERDVATRAALTLADRVSALEREVHEREDALRSAVHELRNPLTSVKAYGQIMSRNLQAVQRQLGQLDRLIGDLLRVPGPTDASSLVLDDVDVVAEAREAAGRIRAIAPDSRVRVTADGPASARIDPVRFAQVLDNMLLNAVKFSPGGVDIEIAVRADDVELVVAVTDRGEGISPDEIAHVFERYYRGARPDQQVPGAGIGLAVAQAIVAAHGGRIDVASPGRGQGATFTIVLPVHTEAGEPVGSLA